MDFYQLKILREVADQGSITGAARALSVTPSAVSQALASLQRQFSAPLSRRRGRIVELTDVGHALAVASVSVASAMAHAESVVDRYLGDLTTTVRVSAFHSAAVKFFPQLISTAHTAEHPPVECVDEDVAQEAFPSLTSSYDIVVAHRMSHSTPWAADRLTVVPLLREPLDIALRADHPLAEKRTLTSSDLVGLPWVSTHSGFSPADMLEAIAASAGQPMRVLHRINDFSTAAGMVAEGNLVALLPRHTAAPPPDSGLVLRPLEGVRTVRNIDMLIRPEHTGRKAVQAVVSALQQITRSLIQTTSAEDPR